MSNNSDKSTGVSDSSERPLIDSAWAQFEALTTGHKTPLSGVRHSLVIPGYRILHEIHRGGQGVVYQAMQESTQHKVAIKVLKEGPLADPTEFARFDREVDVLSRLNHPNIVAIHDRGLTAGGHAYYVMDYIPGQPLDAHVTGAALYTRDILALFHKICAAVNIAHLRGVIHRDLKPSNIRIDEEDEPHVLDFGLAKLAQDKGSSADTMTLTGQFIGSLPWASPEQAEGRSDLLDIRTDVYSLGVILYQLLTRRFPYPVSGRMTEVVQNIIHISPARPSTLVRDIDRDVEIILLKCLEKEPERRYQSAGELARDIQRYMNEEPIEARPATSLYQLRQFTRRNKALVASVIAIIVVLATATTVSVAFALREAAARDRERLALEREVEQRERADREAKQTRTVADFQAQMLADIDPQTMGIKLRADLLAKARVATERSGHTPEEIDARMKELEELIAGVDLTGMALTALDENVFQRALTATYNQFANQPLIQAQLLQTVASTLCELGLVDAATQPQEQALAIRRRLLRDEHPDTLTSISYTGYLLRRQGKLVEAEPYVREALEKRRQVLGDDHPDTLMSIKGMGELFQEKGNLPEAESYHRDGLEKSRRVLGDQHRETIHAITNIGVLLYHQGKWAEAEPYSREALEKCRQVLGDEHPDTLMAINNLASQLQAQGKLSEAEPLLREAVAGFRLVLGGEHPDTLMSINNLGLLHFLQGNLTEADRYYREALQKRRRILGEEHPHTLNSINNMGSLLKAQAKYSEAESYYREALEKRRRVLGELHSDTIGAINNIGWLFDAQGKLAEAEPYYREAVEKFRRALGDQHPNTLVVTGNLGVLLQRQGKHSETVELLAPAEPIARKILTGGNAVRLGRFLTALGRARVATEEYAAAEANLSEAYTILSDTMGATDRDRGDVLSGLAELYDAWHTAAPSNGYDATAAEWKARLQEHASKP